MNNTKAFQDYLNEYWAQKSIDAAKHLSNTMEQNQASISAALIPRFIRGFELACPDPNAESQPFLTGCECSILLSRLLSGNPDYLSIEWYGENYYRDVLARASFGLPDYLAIWNTLREESRLKAKRYFGRIHETDVDRLVIQWTLQTLGAWLPCLRHSAKPLLESDGFRKAQKSDEFKASFGAYRSMRFPLA